MATWLARVLLVAALGLAAVGGYTALRPGAAGPLLAVEQSARDVGPTSPGEHEVVFNLTNSGGHAGRVIGLDEG